MSDKHFMGLEIILFRVVHCENISELRLPTPAFLPPLPKGCTSHLVRNSVSGEGFASSPSEENMVREDAIHHDTKS